MASNHLTIPKGVMLNAYPDSIGSKLSDTVLMLQRPELKEVFSLFYILPTFFNSDLDRGFSIIDYDLNKDLVSVEDIQSLKALNINLKFDIVLNHLSVASPQFNDIIKNGDESKYKDFFINWNDFWKRNSELNDEGIAIPHTAHLDKLFMRKSGLPILKVIFPDGTERPYWNTFYQKIIFNPISENDLVKLGLTNLSDTSNVISKVNTAIGDKSSLNEIDLGKDHSHKDIIIDFVNRHRTYLGQMDVNGKSPLVWEYYEEVLKKLAGYGCSILRLDAFAYLHKEVGESNFFNKPGTWDYLSRINDIAEANGLRLLPEIHAEYGQHLHDEVAEKGYVIYDFFLPGLLIHTLEKKSTTALLKWANDIKKSNFSTVHMLGCHDGIPVLDLKGKLIDGKYHEGLLSDDEIDYIMDLIIARGGRVKNLYGADGKKISYYQVNATYFSALGEDESKMLLARAIQMFMPGIPQVWYLDLFAGKNNYEAVEQAGADGHKEINRTNISMDEVENALQQDIVTKQLALIKLRNTHPAFNGEVSFEGSSQSQLLITWQNGAYTTKLEVDLLNYSFVVKS
jgi:sucrose phosphorylase